MHAPTHDAEPRRRYERRLHDRNAQVAALDRVDMRYSMIRAATLLLGAVVGWAVFDPERLHVAWTGLPLGLFLTLVILHERVVRRRERARRGVRYYERGLARINDSWSGGYHGSRFRTDDHPYASDLDLFGDGSMYQLLCSARTAIGRATLAGWLLEPADREEIAARQQAVRELTGRLNLREDLAVFGQDMVHEVHPEELAGWATAPGELNSPAYRWIAPLLVVLLVGSVLGLLTGVTGRVPLALAFAAHAGFAIALRRRVERVIAAVSRAGTELRLLGGVLERLEQRDFDSPRLRQVAASLRSGSTPPSEAIAKLHRLISLLDSRRNQFFAAFAAVLLWGTQLALAIERWRGQYGQAIPRWLEAVGQFEALASLAAYAYEHPDDPFPEIVEDAPAFVAVQAGHPLLPRAECVRNDVALETRRRLLIVSGSNMSGKSTLLRTVGVNCVLALAGAPVRAQALRLAPLWVGATLRVQDSLRRGTSGFYAEIERFNQLVELSEQQPPVLFLLEEILNTTNSHDRRIGARAVIRSLLDRGAIGLVTTHDLAIAEIVDELEGAANVHFVDHLEGGEVVFDYVLRDGIVSKSNALDLMRSIGLDV